MSVPLCLLTDIGDFKFIAEGDIGNIEPDIIAFMVEKYLGQEHGYYGNFKIKYLAAESFRKAKEPNITKQLYSYLNIKKIVIHTIKNKTSNS